MEMIADLRISHSGRFEISFSFLMEVIMMLMISFPKRLDEKKLALKEFQPG